MAIGPDTSLLQLRCITWDSLLKTVQLLSLPPQPEVKPDFWNGVKHYKTREERHKEKHKHDLDYRRLQKPSTILFPFLSQTLLQATHTHTHTCACIAGRSIRTMAGRG